MRFHLEMKAQENIEAGVKPEEARYAARRQFGNQTLLQEVSRDMWSFRYLETIAQDLRFCFRMMSKNLGFTAVAVLTLTLGIGACTAVFSVVYAVMLKPLPYRDPDRLCALWKSVPKKGLERDWTSYPTFKDWRDHNHVFEDLALYLSTGSGAGNLAQRRSGRKGSGRRCQRKFFHGDGNCAGYRAELLAQRRRTKRRLCRPELWFLAEPIWRLARRPG